jgi:phosphoribosyl-AMP cyclohydrolase
VSDPSEEGLLLAPKFDADGLVTCVATDAKSGELLMVAHMNAEALRRTVESGEAWYFSRSRKALWKKGESSGHTQRVIEMRVDCDQDAVWIKSSSTAQAPATPGGGPASIAWCRSSRPARLRCNSATPSKTFDPNAVYDKK